MTGRGGFCARLLAVRSAIRAAAYPEVAEDADWRRAFADEARVSNARILRWVAGALAPAHLLAVVVFARRPEADPARAAWLHWMVRLHAMEAVLGVLAAIVAWRGRPAALWRVLGDAVGVPYLLCAAAMSANAQRAHANLNAFVIAAATMAFFLRMRPGVFAPAMVAATGIVLWGIAHFAPDTTVRINDVVSLLAAASLAFFGFFMARSMRARELTARRQVERLNAELERRVEAQVSEIVGGAREIEGLNTQLNEKIRERSRELSAALARLAGGHRPLEPGTVLGGRVELEARIGQGAMGIVYRGRDRVTDKTVAVKVVHAGSASELDGLHRFLREAEALASLTHPAIVRSLHVDVSDDGLLFQVMELVEGETLEALLARGPLSPGVASRLVAVLAEALAAAHAAGVVHRDVKPSNVMLTRAAPGLKLLDFGISKLRDASGGTEGRILGTPEFLSPEQVNDPNRVDAPADVYALGLILYLCLAGRMPFETASARNWLIAHLVQSPAELSRYVEDLDPALGKSVMACLDKEPGARPTASAMAATLARVADDVGTPPLVALDLVRVQGSEVAGRGPSTRSLTGTGATFRSRTTLSKSERTKG
jgi:eukaryotic-like serine/threonine-protein kinase